MGALLLSLIVGAPGFILAALIDRGFDLSKASAIDGLQTGSPAYWQLFITGGILGSMVIPFFAFCMIGYLRRKIIEVEREISELLPDGKEFSHRTFGRISDPIPPIVLMLVLISLFYQSAIALYAYEVGVATSIQRIAYIGLDYFAIATLIWIYFSASWGLHKLGQLPLVLRPVHEDRMMGVGAIGSLSLALAFAYFSGEALSTIALFATGIGTSLQYISLTGQIIVGIALFILPLLTIHRKMDAAKRQERLKLSEEYRTVLWPGVQDPAHGTESTLERIERLLSIEMHERRIASIPVWPLDTSAVGKLVAIVLSVITILVAHIVQLALHL